MARKCKANEVVVCGGDFNQRLSDEVDGTNLCDWAASSGLQHGLGRKKASPEIFTHIQPNRDGSINRGHIDHVWLAGPQVEITQYVISEAFLLSDHCLIRVVVNGSGLARGDSQAHNRRVVHQGKQRQAFVCGKEWNEEHWARWTSTLAPFAGKWDHWGRAIDSIPATTDVGLRELIRGQLEQCG
jgi:hypothetical protein